LRKTYVKYPNFKLYYQQLHLTYVLVLLGKVLTTSSLRMTQ